jgi:hypothetical protein
MIRELVDMKGRSHPLRPASELRACTFPASEIGWPKEAALKLWFQHREKADIKYASQKKKGGIVSSTQRFYCSLDVYC